MANKTGKSRDRLTFRKSIKGYLFILPWLIGFVGIMLGPMLFSLYASFNVYNITNLMKWRGFRNYLTIFTNDNIFPTVIYNTAYYVLFSVPLAVIFALILALLLNTKVKGIGIFRTVFYVPSVLSGVAVALLWWWVFNPFGGLINNFLAIIHIQGPGWFNDPNWSKPALIVTRMWGVGGSMILFLAAFQDVPRTLYEACEIDGAKGLKKFFHITLPLISPTMLYVIVTGVIGAFQTFDNAYIISQGDGRPENSMLFYMIYLYRKAFIQGQMGYACALAWVLFVIIMIITGIQLLISRRWVYYEGGGQS